MKYLLLLAISIGLTSCETSKKISDSKDTNVSLQSDCPDDGSCTVSLMRNKSLKINYDTYGDRINDYELVDDAAKSVVLFEYVRTIKDTTLQDAGYREEIIVEVDNEKTEMNWSDNELKNANVLYGRFCYCKGYAGYFKMDKGDLSVMKKNGKILVDLKFKMDRIPQVISELKATMK